jgi:hypothetical protein
VRRMESGMNVGYLWSGQGLGVGESTAEREGSDIITTYLMLFLSPLSLSLSLSILGN